MMTPLDEDRQIRRLEIHRDIIGKIIQELAKEGIEATRTTGNSTKGDILIIREEHVPKAKQILRNLNNAFNQ